MCPCGTDDKDATKSNPISPLSALTAPHSDRTIDTTLPLARAPRTTPVIPRRYLVVPVLALPVLVVTFAVLAGATFLAAALGDAPGTAALKWVAMSSLIVLVIDAILLLALLGIRAVQEDEDQTRP